MEAPEVSKSDSARAVARDIMSCLPDYTTVEGGATAMTAISLVIATIFLDHARGDVSVAVSAIEPNDFMKSHLLAVAAVSAVPLSKL